MTRPLHTSDITPLFYGFVLTLIIVYTLAMAYYAINQFFIEWKTKMWEVAPESHVIEEVKYIIRKHNECADLDTIESVISESINLTKYSEPYRIECFRQGLKHRVRMLENV